jgi:hypothetical protein
MLTSKSSCIVRVATSVVVCATLALGTAGVALAGQSHHGDHSSIGSRDHGHSNEARGVVSVLGTNSITLTDRHGTPTTYTTTSTTTYFEGSTAGVVGDLAVGQKVSLELSTTTPQTVTKVTICLVRVFGTVTAVAGNVITIAGFHDSTSATTVGVSSTTTYTSGGAASTLAAVVVGSKISAVGLAGTTAGTVNANSVNIFAADNHGGGHGDNHSGGQGSGHGHNKSFGHSRH